MSMRVCLTEENLYNTFAVYEDVEVTGEGKKEGGRKEGNREERGRA
jgi:hypothetical protein